MVSPRKYTSKQTPVLTPPRLALLVLPVFLFLAHMRSDVSIFLKLKPLRFCEVRKAEDTACIFDIGLNTGQDTKIYLAHSPTTRVVAVEAEPFLVEKAREKFSDALKEGRLKLMGIGLVGNATGKREKLEFWVNDRNSRFSSFKQRTGCRTPRGEFLEEGNTTFCHKIEMDTMSCEELVREFGTPDYMKVDIEGMDRPCLESLGNLKLEERPQYASKENAFEYDVGMFQRLGYNKFKVVNQAYLQEGLWGDDEGHSGPWGEEAADIWKGKVWLSGKEMLERLPVPKTVTIKGKEYAGWYDLHASK